MIRKVQLRPSAPGLARASAIEVWSSDLLAGERRFVQAMTLRNMNMSLIGGGARAEAIQNRRALCDALELPFDRLTVAQQVHGCEVVPVDGALAGAGRESGAEAVAYVDGLYTRHALHPLLGLSADCPIIVLFDPDTPAVGVAHAGWRGTFAGIATRLTHALINSFGSKPARLLAAISPSAGPCCYEVREDVLRIVRTRCNEPDRFLRHEARRTYLDLWSANVAQLQAAGIPLERIDVAGLCTICDPRFCSYRRDGRATAHAGLLAALRA
ncbi:MAG: polyphenol oxidase family protein [Planctomycetota bacterium]